MPKCSRCHAGKPYDDFSKDRTKASGHKSLCKECDKSKSREYYDRVRGPAERAARGFVPKHSKGPGVCACGVPITTYARQCAPCAGVALKEGAEAERKRKRRGAKIPAAVRLAVYERDEYVCWMCGSYVDLICSHNDELAPTLDHILPISKGGDESPENLRTAHRNCNGGRGNREGPWRSAMSAAIED